MFFTSKPLLLHSGHKLFSPTTRVEFCSLSQQNFFNLCSCIVHTPFKSILSIKLIILQIYLVNNILLSCTYFKTKIYGSNKISKFLVINIVFELNLLMSSFLFTFSYYLTYIKTSKCNTN